MTARTSSWSSFFVCCRSVARKCICSPRPPPHESPTDYVPSSSENLKNIHGVLTLTITLTLTLIIAEVFKGYLFSVKTGPRGLTADARRQTQTCLHDADGHLQAHPWHSRMLYWKDVFNVFVYISVFGIRTKIFRNLTNILTSCIKTLTPPHNPNKLGDVRWCLCLFAFLGEEYYAQI